MPFIKISGLTTATAVSATNQFEINQNSTSRSATVAQVAAFARGTATEAVVLPAGTVSAPGLTFTGDTNTGIYSPAADTIAFTEGGVEAMRLDASGNVGIGTTTPGANLDVRGTGNRFIRARSDDTTGSAIGYVGAEFGPTASLQMRAGNGYTYLVSSGVTDPLLIGTNSTERMRIDTSGNVGIGTSSPTGRLSVTNGDDARVKIFSNGGSVGVIDAVANTNDATNRWLSINPTGGNVGIGTASPAGRLHVSGSSDITTQVLESTGSVAARFNLRTTSDSNGFLNYDTGNWIFFNNSGGSAVERMRIDSAGNVGIGTSSPNATMHLYNATNPVLRIAAGADAGLFVDYISGFGANINVASNFPLIFGTNNTERARISSDGSFIVGKTSANFVLEGAYILSSGIGIFTAKNDRPLGVSRLASDGTLVSFWQDGTEEGNISVSGTTVSYNGGHLARWSQLPTNQRDPALFKGTVLSNLDEMCEWLDAEGNPLPNEQLNRMKISDVEGDPNVAGVFVNWDNDDQANSYDINIAMTGDMIIRIAPGVVVQKGELLMSAGDGTATPQGDDIVRSKTIAKVTSNYVTCTYPDGSYCVPCVLMAC